MGNMKKSRAFFCAVDLMDSDIMAMGRTFQQSKILFNLTCLLSGGYSENKTILKSTEYFSISKNWTVESGKSQYRGNKELADMLVSRSGHACSLLTSQRSKILVSGKNLLDK